jgi:cytochrome oxidase assembly protein ShyY1
MIKDMLIGFLMFILFLIVIALGSWLLKDTPIGF